MKQRLFILLSLAAALFVSCSKSDKNTALPDETFEYVFYQPIMEWNVDIQKIRSEMSKMTDWVEDTDLTDEETLIYANKKNMAPQMTYFFEKEKMTRCSIMYLSCNDKFNQMKDDWTKELSLTWSQYEFSGITYYEADCRPKKCTIIVMKGSSSGYDYMNIEFRYTKDIFE